MLEQASMPPARCVYRDLRTQPMTNLTVFLLKLVPVVLLIRHWEVTARVQKAFLSFFWICLIFF